MEQVTCTTSPLRTKPAVAAPVAGPARVKTVQARPPHVAWTVKALGVDAAVGGVVVGATVVGAAVVGATLVGATVVGTTVVGTVVRSLLADVAAREPDPVSRCTSATAATVPHRTSTAATADAITIRRRARLALRIRRVIGGGAAAGLSSDGVGVASAGNSAAAES